ncbi:NAD-dependent epimerase/dehydratase family protein [Croceimicrobium hydrocarbonivorans]|uniref:NAD-dependent epimerase/dehydratase family protein n=1 Tax=Croceimicrobium hydrocarbonivorans TaxID=2761580 RepID=A0A7H0VAD2_9FLAO|nr:NAD-dependent epimerase/dehydratase family protein [Croceimicrobium hydrocarbonivorans]QNR22680.1 NAD-dependent epimerase/dehydratase family protein [Croceimicrobium hydrocarbonivorans]
MADKILVLGSSGQIGTDLVDSLREAYGNDNVIASDLKAPSAERLAQGPFEQLDALDDKKVFEVIKKHGINQVYHLVAMLSATAEKMPLRGWDLNMRSLFNFLELAREGHISKMYWPSSIAAFGPNTPVEATPQYTVMDPGTVYGISKLAGELWCDYYHKKYGCDLRGLRYPGLISWKTEPGGGTTDYAVDIFHKAAKGEDYHCFLSENRRLPMMYMPDAIKATIGIMEAPAEQVKIRTSYNVGAFSFTPRELSALIEKEVPGFQTFYDAVDSRDAIAAGWPQSIDDQRAKQDWGWQPDFSLEAMVKDMLANLKA